MPRWAPMHMHTHILPEMHVPQARPHSDLSYVEEYASEPIFISPTNRHVPQDPQP